MGNETSNLAALLLAGGYGKRLLPYSKTWPKCLMPIQNRPLLDYWLFDLNRVKPNPVIVNTHYLSNFVKDYLDRPKFKPWVIQSHEKKLLGTAGTLRSNYDLLKNKTVILAHADNWCRINIQELLKFHLTKRPNFCKITMVTFKSPNPSSCGIIETNKQNVVLNIKKKKSGNFGDLANGAIYILEPSILEFIMKNTKIKDFSTEVIPYFFGQITTWHNEGIHRDIGSIEALREAQLDKFSIPNWGIEDKWQKQFIKMKIHNLINHMN